MSLSAISVCPTRRQRLTKLWKKLKLQAVKPHPRVNGWRPVFRHRSDRAVETTIRWIESMMKPRIDYPVEFVPPVIGPDPAAADDPTRTGR